MVNSVNQQTNKPYSVIKTMQRYKKAIITLIAMLSAASIYDNPQGFLNLWMTRDQQGAIFLQQGDAERAAITFEEKNWSAYSFYQAGNYEQALLLFKKQEGEAGLFAQANAHAHLGQIFKAKALYEAIINANHHHEGAIKNLKLMESIIKNLKKSAKKVTELTEDGKVDSNTKQVETAKVKSQTPTDQLWLKQVQQNPSKFLRKKFQQEHANAGK